MASRKYVPETKNVSGFVDDIAGTSSYETKIYDTYTGKVVGTGYGSSTTESTINATRNIVDKLNQ